MKISWEELAILRGIANVDGRIEQAAKDGKETDKNDNFWVSLFWLNDWFKTGNSKDDDNKGYYYIGYDMNSESYIVEWRGTIKYPKIEAISVRERVVCVSDNGYLKDMAKLLVEGIKKHKKFIKKETP